MKQTTANQSQCRWTWRRDTPLLRILMKTEKTGDIEYGWQQPEDDKTYRARVRANHALHEALLRRIQGPAAND
jgi:hypothetical protein